MDHKPYGSWVSPITAEALADAQIGFGNLRNFNGHLYWTENVPAAGAMRGDQLPFAIHWRTWAAMSRMGANQTPPLSSMRPIMACVYRHRASRPERKGCHTGTHRPPLSHMASNSSHHVSHARCGDTMGI